MSGLRPIKIRLLELFSDGGEHWNSDIVRTVQKEYSMPSDYQRDYINFDIVELAAGGMLKSVDEKLDLDGSYKQDILIQKYVLTDFGKKRLTECLS